MVFLPEDFKLYPHTKFLTMMFSPQQEWLNYVLFTQTLSIFSKKIGTYFFSVTDLLKDNSLTKKTIKMSGQK